MRRSLMGLLGWSNSSRETRVATVLLGAWIALPVLAVLTTEPGHSISPAIGVAGITVQLMFFGSIFVGLLRGGIQEFHARRLGRMLSLFGGFVNLVMVFDPGSPAVAIGLVGMLAAALALRYEGVAGGLFLGYVVVGTWQARAPLDSPLDGPFPPYQSGLLLENVFFFGLPSLGVGILLLMLWRRGRSHSSAGRAATQVGNSPS